MTATLLAAHPDPVRDVGSRLWVARAPVEGGVPGWLDRVGRPITYGHLRVRPPLAAYQTVFSRDPGSAEMPSAGRRSPHMCSPSSPATTSRWRR